jgi:hypothetical protein
MKYQLFEILATIPIIRMPLEQSIKNTWDSHTVEMVDIESPPLEFFTKEFGAIESIEIPLYIYLSQLYDYKVNKKKFKFTYFGYVPFVENEKTFLMVLLISKYNSKEKEKVENINEKKCFSLRYVYQITENIENLRFCESYDIACCVMMGFMRELGNTNGKNKQQE